MPSGMASNFSGSRLDAMWSTRAKKAATGEFEEFKAVLFQDLRKFEEDSQRKREADAVYLQECCAFLRGESVALQKDLGMVLGELDELHARVQSLEGRA
jgi:hypothetical protein